MLKDPTRGDTDAIRTAARLLNGRAQALVNDRATADRQAEVATDGRWTGAAAAAFATTMDGFSTTAVGIVDAWDRLATTLVDYASRLDALQDDYQTALASLDPDAGVRANARHFDDMHEAGTRRRSLDAEIVRTLGDSAGPGAAMWIATTTGPDGRRLSDQKIIEEIIGRVDDGAITVDDLDLVQQFLLQNASDPALCDKFYTALGATGTVDLLDAAVTVPGMSDLDTRRAQQLLSLLSTSLTSAATTWTATACQEFGAALVDTITDPECSAIVTVPALLSAAGLTPDISAGAFVRLEQIRTTDPALFAQIGVERGPESLFGDAGLAAWALGSTGVVDLAASIFGGISTDPQLALEAFGGLTGDPRLAPELTGATWAASATERIDYWFYERDWSLGGFTAPTELLASVITCPTLQEGRYSASKGTPWYEVTTFASRAVEGLGANRSFTVSSISAAATEHLITALTPYIPEIAACATNGDPDKSTQHIYSGLGVHETAGLEMNRGNLARLLGITLAQEGSLESFGDALNFWKSGLVTAINNGKIPTDEVKTALEMLGAMQGFTAAYGAEVQIHAGNISDAHQQRLDLAFTLLSFIPGASTGSEITDYLAGIGAGQAQGVIAAMDPQILSDDELSRLGRDPRTDGTLHVTDIAQNKMTSSLDEALHLTPEALATLRDQTPAEIVRNAYATTANATSNINSTQDYSIVAPDALEGGPSTPRRDMP